MQGAKRFEQMCRCALLYMSYDSERRIYNLSRFSTELTRNLRRTFPCNKQYNRQEHAEECPDTIERSRRQSLAAGI
ncbi:hypothetical protein M758_6G167100 [Ceratodon purpureus]|nr:hypothetical protein M758_6G167100 [Ceratodon purpureus]